MGPLRQAVFLDRDGVLIRAVERDGMPYPTASVHELEFLPGVAAACTVLRQAGALLFCVTNQPDVARGTKTRENVEAINAAVRNQLLLDGFATCYHDDHHGCACRKPKPGMITALATEFSVDATQSVMVGDRWRDIEAGRAAGCATVLIGDGYAEGLKSSPDAAFSSLESAVPWILEFLRKGALQ